ncbi:hypothetical protein AB0G71_08545 [Streptomyces sp. NPDC020403]|uniref:hypothetical protein n=1 Tax=unclassified Streptomyces TaxID=2593676 RepID=UPI0033C3AF63
MEQRIDSNTKPEFAAGTDPAYIPGLTAPAPARTEGKTDEAAEAADARAGAESGEDPAAAAGRAPVPDDADAAVQEEAGGGSDAGKEDGPVFEVSDRRGSIRVDREGVRFRLDDQEADFDWSEIGAVEVKTARFGRRFTVTVHLSSRRWFNAEVEAAARSSLKEWTAGLDAALDAYFDEAA